MDIQRITNIILSDLGVENLKLHDKLETLVNSDMEIDTRVDLIKNCLLKIVNNENMVNKFSSLINNQESKTTQNEQI